MSGRQDDDLGTLAAIAKLEDRDVPTWGLAIVGFIGADGEPQYAYCNRGDARTAEIIGHMEMVKADMVNDALNDEG